MPHKFTPRQILNDPLLNKGTAFTQEERDQLGLHGFLPHHIATLEEQLDRRYQTFQQKTTQLAKYSFLHALQNRNEVLFYRLVYEHLSEMVPLIYTPTIGDVSLHFSSLYREHRGLYLSYPMRDKISDIIDQIAHEELDVVVATDGERILGLGDVGIGGMAISQGKLALYTLFGGIHPARTLPVMLDVGTNNPRLLEDPTYLGWRHPRITGEEYDAFIDKFVSALKKRHPHILLQWEDFAKPHAAPLLHRYQNQLCSFNDDIQGTAGVTLAAILSACKAKGERLIDQKIAVLGGGSAGIGISQLIVQAMQAEGLSKEDALDRFYIVDIHGILREDLPHLEAAQRPFAREWKAPFGLQEVIARAQPTVLIGVSAQPGAFTQPMIELMAQSVPRPIIFPLSNPTSRCEATPEDLIEWTKGQAIIATGSPFPPVHYKNRFYPITQCNNVSIFPGVGLAAVAGRLPRVTDEMFIRAAHVLSSYSPIEPLFPPLTQLREVSRKIAIALIEFAEQQGMIPTTSLAAIETQVARAMWFPHYEKLEFS